MMIQEENSLSWRGGSGPGSSGDSSVTATPPSVQTPRRNNVTTRQKMEKNKNNVTGQLSLIDDTTESTSPPMPIILLRGSTVVLGRAANCDVIFSSLQISRKHCQLEFRDAKWFLRDMSTNGMKIGGRMIEKDTLHVLNNQDLVQLVPTGALTYRFLETSKPGRQPKPQPVVVPPRAPIIVDSDDDDDSLLSVDHDVDLLECCKNTKNRKKNRDEQDSVLIIEATVGDKLVKAKTTSSPLKRPPSSLASQADSEDSMSLLANKKQKTDINHLLLQVERLQADNEMLKTSHLIEREEFIQKRDTEVLCLQEQFKEELSKKFSDVLEVEFSCCVCSGVFIEPTSSPSCGHTFCNYCIMEWLTKKSECPICRSPINSQSQPKKHIEMGNYILKVYEILGDDYRERRELQVQEREKEKETAKQAKQQQQQQLQNQRNAGRADALLFNLEMLNTVNAIAGGINVPVRRGRRGGAAHVPVATTHRRSRRTRNGGNVDNNDAGGLPGGQPPPPPVNAFNMLPGMLNMNPNGPHRTPRHPFFHLPGIPLPQHFPPFNNQFEPFLHNNDVLLID